MHWVPSVRITFFFEGSVYLCSTCSYTIFSLQSLSTYYRHLRILNEYCHYANVHAVADSGGANPLRRLVMYFCVNNCTSPSNDYTAVECSNNDQAQLNTHVSVPY